MSPFRSVELGNVRPDPLQEERAKWEALEMDIPPDFPRLNELRTIANKGKLAILNLQVMRDRIDGGAQVQKSTEELKDLYRQAVEIKAGAWLPSLGQKLNVPQGTAVDTALLKEIDPIKDQEGLQSIGLDMERIALGLAVNPADVLLGVPVQGNRYFTVFRGAPAVQYEQVNASMKALDSYRTSLVPLMPSATGIIDRLQAGLRHLDTINPVHAVGNKEQVYANQNGRTMDTRPLKLVTALGGGMLAGLGLASSIMSGNPITWPTFMWGGLAAYSMYPEMFDSASEKTMRFIASLNTPLTQKLMANGFRDKAFTELQEARRDPNKLKVMNQMTNALLPVTAAQIGILTDQKDTPLSRSLAAMSEKEVRETIGKFGRAMSQGNQQLVTTLLKA